LSKYKWHAAKQTDNFYATRNQSIKGSKQRQILMHREVLKVPDHLFVDHINRNGLDNRKANLRPATVSENNCNRTKRRDGTYSSQYKGFGGTATENAGGWGFAVTEDR
jgi:hypothetical protein